MDRPIGIIDSGVGGLSIWQELVKLLPWEDIIYLADQRNFPYRAKQKKELYRIVSDNVKFLVKQKAKLIVLACNTATVHTLDGLRQNFPVPIVGVVPVVKKAAELSRKKKIIVLATSSTAQSNYLKNLVKKFAGDCQVFIYALDEVIDQIENLQRIVITGKIANLSKKDVDVVALGCTHYGFIKPQLQKLFGKKVRVLEPAGAVTRQVKRVLTNNQTLAGKRTPRYTFYTTGDAIKFNKQLRLLLKKEFLAKKP
ncbi:glutamate racemase [Candidatus Microgenomates bacterium]|nr:glutamate racemase [Candidatus Microgenomates bacterium]